MFTFLMISHFPELVYVKTKQGFDFMCAAIEKHDSRIVESIFASGFQYSKITSYDIFSVASNHLDEQVIKMSNNHLHNI